MTSQVRKEAWLTSLEGPVPITPTNRALIWFRFRRAKREYRLVFDARNGDRGVVYLYDVRAMTGSLLPKLRGISALLCSRLEPAQLAVGIATTITRNHAQGTPS